ncbi:MAG: serine/threonine-protein phosphatase [Crocinitomicaceae bacterium]|nr:serine/threonine-protein phosphatase [Crocinitomicaceae bacterium]
MENQFVRKVLDQFSKHIAIFVLFVSVGIMAYILYDLSIAKEKTAQNFLEKVSERTFHGLNNFFQPVEQQLTTTAAQLGARKVDLWNTEQLKSVFVPIMERNSSVNVIGLYTESGLDFDVMRDTSEGAYLVRSVNQIDSSSSYFRSYFSIQDKILTLDSIWKNEYEHGELASQRNNRLTTQMNTLLWSDPYILRNSKQSGITVSYGWLLPHYDNQRAILSLDIKLSKISHFINDLQPSENGEIMITTGDKNAVIGLRTKAKDLLSDYQPITNVSEIDNPELIYILNQPDADKAFKFRQNGHDWWGLIKPYLLNEEQQFYVLIAIPEKDFIQELKEAQLLMVGGFFGISFLTLLILRSHYRINKQKKKLTKQNIEILEKNKIIAAKREAILESINYAKRIQTAILPPHKLMLEKLPSSFVLYLPKDIVAGDFYWLEDVNNRIYFAAADCTGHGVPGAMVSVMCHNALNRCVRELKLTCPGKILDQTKTFIKEEFAQSESKIKDGMDISLCVWEPKERKLQWAGANNPLWIKRENSEELEIIKPDKQPIANYIIDEPFTAHHFDLFKGDVVYLFSDGFADQFGGERGKKFKIGALKKLVLSIAHLPMNEQKRALERAFQEWKGELEQIDDVCFMGVKLD